MRAQRAPDALFDHNLIVGRKALGMIAVFGLLAASAIAAYVDPKTLVLRLADLPAGFSITAEDYMTNRDAASGDAVVAIPIAKLTRWGRVNGYERTFDRDDSTATFNAGFLSNVSVYTTAAGAKSATSYLFARFPSRSQWQTFVPKTLVVPGRIGEAAPMYQFPTVQGATSIFLVWRSGRVQALFGLAGTEDVTPARALRSARIMDNRIRRLK